MNVEEKETVKAVRQKTNTDVTVRSFSVAQYAHKEQFFGSFVSSNDRWYNFAFIQFKYSINVLKKLTNICQSMLVEV